MATSESTTLPALAQPERNPEKRSTTEAFSHYLEAQLALSGHTCLSYRLAMRDFEKWLNKPAVKARRAEIYNYLADRMNTHCSRSVAHRLSVLKHFFAFATDEGFIREDPTQDLRGPKQVHKLPEGALSTIDVKKMLKAAGTTPMGLRDKVILLLGFDAGLRESEMVALTVDAVFLKDHIIRLRHGKGDKSTSLPLLGFCASAIRKYLKQGRPKILGGRESPYLLVGRQGPRLTRQEIFFRVRDLGMAALGRKTSPHKLRSGFATVLNNAGMDVRSLQSLMRHADLSTTSHYINLDVKQLRREYYKSFPRARRRTA